MMFSPDTLNRAISTYLRHSPVGTQVNHTAFAAVAEVFETTPHLLPADNLEPGDRVICVGIRGEFYRESYGIEIGNIYKVFRSQNYLCLEGGSRPDFCIDDDEQPFFRKLVNIAESEPAVQQPAAPPPLGDDFVFMVCGFIQDNYQTQIRDEKDEGVNLCLDMLARRLGIKIEVEPMKIVPASMRLILPGGTVDAVASLGGVT